MKRPPRWLFLALALVALLLGVLISPKLLRPVPKGKKPLVTVGVRGPAEAPADLVLLTASDFERVVSPMCVVTSGMEGAVYLTIPDKTVTNDVYGSAETLVASGDTGRYCAWARVLWDDACGNSVLMSLDGSRGTVVGQDAVYGDWHWVRAGQYDLGRSNHVALVGREDGVAIDQLAFTGDPAFVPSGRLRSAGTARDLRVFGDAFDRSAGHGLGAWRVRCGDWGINFSLDPNRIPLQYAMRGTPTNNYDAVVMAATDPWQGCSVDVAVYAATGDVGGVALESGEEGDETVCVLLDCSEAQAQLRIERPGRDTALELPVSVGAGQWHRLSLERWGWLLRVRLNGESVWEAVDLSPRAEHVGLLVRQGRPAFDDFSIREIPWVGDDGSGRPFPWRADRGARWFVRAEPCPGTGGLFGHRGTIRTSFTGLPVSEAAVVSMSLPDLSVATAGLTPVRQVSNAMWFAGADVASTSRVAELALSAEGRPVVIDCVMARAGNSPDNTFTIGPFRFNASYTKDPSDYLDFTAEEYQAIRRSPEADKLVRRQKYMPMVGVADRSVWQRVSGLWRVVRGVLSGRGPGSRVWYSRELLSDCTLEADVILRREGDAAELALYAGYGDEARIQLRTTPGPAGDGAVFQVSAGPAPHRVRLAVDGPYVTAVVDGCEPRRVGRRQELGGHVELAVADGRAEFDNVEIVVERETDSQRFTVFDRRETDWRREGDGWRDHGGIACVLASHWISMKSPSARSTLWHRREWQEDLAVGIVVEEFTEWYGWRATPQHTHFPFHHLCVELAATDYSGGYELEVNANRGKTTILRRAGEVVATVAQDASFPLFLEDDHSPYEPRHCRIVLAKHGGHIRAAVNGKVVLTYEDPVPLAVSRVGVGGHDTHANFAQIEIRERD